MWIRDYRERHRLTVSGLARKVLFLSTRRPGGNPVHAERIIANLERDPDFRTVPGIADLIAEACDATPRQRDTLVLNKYRGTWRPGRKHVVRQKTRWHGVAAIDREGRRVCEYPNTLSAARDHNVSSDYVRERCQRTTREELEFNKLDVTFRWIEEV